MLEKPEGMVDSILSKSTPLEGARQLDHVRFAALCDAFQHHEKAISQYETLLKTRPDDSVLRFRMLHLLAQTDPEKAVAELKRLKKDEPSEGFVSIALNAISQADMPLKQRLDTTETLMKLIEIPDGESDSPQD